MELNTDYDIEKAFRAIEDELIASMIRNLDGHRAEEDKLGFNWSQWQVEQLKALEKYKADNKKRFQSKFSDINGSIDAMIFTARQTGGTEQEQKILRAIKNGLKASKVSQGTEGAFFKLNTRKLEALIKATKADFTRAEHSMLRMSEDKYRQIIFNAQVYANTGAGTYEKAVDMATRDFLKAGINCIEYANGSRHTVKDYARMAIQTASKRAYLTGEGEMRQQWGISTVIMNKRANACPKCLPFVTQYKSFEAYIINDVLRNANDLSNLKSEHKQLVNNLDAALSKISKFNGNLIRTVDFSDSKDEEDRIKEFVSEYVEGTIITIKQYWSTSKTEGYNDLAKIKIYIQNTKNGRDISSIGLNENEVLYERNSKFKVISKILVGEIWHILLEEAD